MMTVVVKNLGNALSGIAQILLHQHALYVKNLLMILILVDASLKFALRKDHVLSTKHPFAQIVRPANLPMIPANVLDQYAWTRSFLLPLFLYVMFAKFYMIAKVNVVRSLVNVFERFVQQTLLSHLALPAKFWIQNTVIVDV